MSGPEDGTIDISVDCFVNHCGEILKNYEQMGFKKIIVLVHHQGGNIGALIKTAILKFGMYEVADELGGGWWTKNIQRAHQSNINIEGALLVIGDFGSHGGRGETQAIVALYPELVHLENLTKNEEFWNESVIEVSDIMAHEQMKKAIEQWAEKLKD